MSKSVAILNTLTVCGLVCLGAVFALPETWHVLQTLMIFSTVVLSLENIRYIVRN